MPETRSLASHHDLLLIATELLKDHEGLHSEFQVRWMMIARNGLTPYGCLKQTLLEIETRVLALIDGEVTAQRIDHDDQPTRFNPRDQILKQRHKDLVRELAILCEIAAKLKESIGALSSKRRYDFEIELWTLRIKRMAAIDFVTTGRLCRDTIELTTAIPLPQRTEILREILNPLYHEDLIKNCLNHEVQSDSISLFLQSDENCSKQV
jgi:hypothetical protein